MTDYIRSVLDRANDMQSRPKPDEIRSQDSKPDDSLTRALKQHAALMTLWTDTKELGEPCDVIQTAVMASIEMVYALMQDSMGVIPMLEAEARVDEERAKGLLDRLDAENKVEMKSRSTSIDEDREKELRSRSNEDFYGVSLV